MLKSLAVALVVCVVSLATAFALDPRENEVETITFLRGDKLSPGNTIPLAQKAASWIIAP